MTTPADETFGVAVVRAWNREGRLLIRVITDGLDQGDDFSASSYPTESIDDALLHLRSFLEKVGA